MENAMWTRIARACGTLVLAAVLLAILWALMSAFLIVFA
jgi:hypothetical protein